MMEIFRILDDLESIVKVSKKVPFSNGKIVVDGNDLLDRVDRIRAIMPEEFETARLVISEKERIVKEACMHADQYVEDSRDKVARMVDDNEITRNAVSMSEEIVGHAEEIAKEIRKEANEYADQILSHIELVLSRSLDTVNQGREELLKEIETDSI